MMPPTAIASHERPARVHTPAAVVLIVLAILAWGGAWGIQMMIASALIPGVEADPRGYWFVYSTLAAVLATGLYYAYFYLRVKMHSLFLRRTRRARLTGSEIAEQYLLRKEMRERRRPVNGVGGPVPRHWQEYLNRPRNP